MRTEFISRKYATQYSNENAKITAQASEIIPNVPTVRMFGKQEEEEKSFDRVVAGAEKIGKKKEKREKEKIENDRKRKR